MRAGQGLLDAVTGADLKNPVVAAGAGDIISIAGFPTATVNATLCHLEVVDPIPSIPIDPPTVSMSFSVNDSPLQGQVNPSLNAFLYSILYFQEGNRLTSNMIGERLFREVETNVAMRVLESSGKDSFEVRGRGELHLGVLIENMRREGFELSVSPPRVLLKKDKLTNELLEPMEEAIMDVPTSFSGSIIQKLTKRKGELKNFLEQDDRVKLTFEVPSRGLLGFASEFKNDTSGQGFVVASNLDLPTHIPLPL